MPDPVVSAQFVLALAPASLPSNTIFGHRVHPSRTPLASSARWLYLTTPDRNLARRLPPDFRRSNAPFTVEMVANPASGGAGTGSKPNASKNGLSATGPRSPAAQSRRKQTGVLDQKALALEDEFKTKHLGVLGVLAWIM